MKHHNHHTVISIVDHIVNITSHTEIELLEVSLLIALNDLIPTTDIRLFRVQQTGERKEISTLISSEKESISTVDDSEKSQSLSDELAVVFESISQHGKLGSVFDETRDEWQIIYPSFDENNKIFMFLVQHCQEPTSEQQKIIHGIFKVFANHVALIEKTQRDKLTGLFNRETLDDEIIKILVSDNTDKENEDSHDARRSSGKLRNWLGVIDIDHFKAVNDNFGHLYGDEVLILTSRLMTSGCMRDDDLVYRYGGEEFVVLLKATSEKDARSAFERLRLIVAEHAFPQVGNITISIGFVEVTGQQTASDVIGEADGALYYAKHNGRNQTQSYSQLVEQGILVVSEQVATSDVELF